MCSWMGPRGGCSAYYLERVINCESDHEDTGMRQDYAKKTREIL